jgi:hypothetical protein
MFHNNPKCMPMVRSSRVNLGQMKLTTVE